MAENFVSRIILQDGFSETAKKYKQAASQVVSATQKTAGAVSQASGVVGRFRSALSSIRSTHKAEIKAVGLGAVEKIEGFSFFICNAWELMLKAELLNRNISIYYKDKPERTLSLEACIKKIYTDENTRIRLNLERIVELRNISTHFITEDYEVKYAPLFQACVLNYTNEMKRFHNRDVTEKIAHNFLTIAATYEPLSNEQIRLKYPPEIAEKFIQQANEIDVLSETYNSEKFSIGIKQNLYITKKKKDTDFTVSIEKSSDNKVAIVKELKDPANTHKYTFGNVIKVVKERLLRDKIRLGNPKGFTTRVLTLFIDFYNVKSEQKYAYLHEIGNQKSYTYSEQFIDFLYGEIKKDPQHFVESLKAKK